MKRRTGFLALLATLLGGCAGTPPSTLGLHNQRLAPCPDTPNCVCSQYDSEKHAIAPFVYEGERQAAYDKLLAILGAGKRVRIISKQDNYIHAEFTSLVFRFVDDVEFYFPTDQTIVHVRSASRIGHSDFGVNRKRVEHLRELFRK